MKNNNVGIVGTGIYLPEKRMTAAQISVATKGVWSETAVIEKLGISEKPIPDTGDGTQEMGVKAALDALKNCDIDPLDIDLILCIGEEWKEYPLTTSGIYIQYKIGAINAWAIDVQLRCCTTVAALKIAKDMMITDSELKTVMIVGGYRNGDFIDYEDSAVSFMFNLSAGAGAIILQRDFPKNHILGTHIITDGSLARDAGVKYGGTEYPIDDTNYKNAYKSLKLFDEKHMKDRLNEVSMPNWFYCIDKAFEKSDVSKNELGFLCCLHFKKSMYEYMLTELKLDAQQSIYLQNYGHMGQIDQILLLHLAQQQGKLKPGTVVSMIAAGIGYAWGANVIRWG
ncbi:MAG: 3-oxoacyl-ACP synthase [Prevotellaceae bacterium]|jgi:3-oxoacyl-[acyl-carrier-protein] synthase-3|nr:3-oxoacyl-ACP synthase [Prevotellaceae bacterium]